VGFVVNKVALVEIFLRAFPFFPGSVIPPMLYIRSFFCRPGYVILGITASLNKHLNIVVVMTIENTVAGLGPEAGIRCSELMGYRYGFTDNVGNEITGHSR
jgi:hypothetical protein